MIEIGIVHKTFFSIEKYIQIFCVLYYTESVVQYSHMILKKDKCEDTVA
ncbi:hypothetical protein MNB_SV-10-291 [hydrothermal vent metagenome]|uniref:Uncharacterized protein n=1 Tax=hydrothermal vent metagenome TaxID=652676 RepID=A0A1W1BQA9_9ZZZZ